MKKVIKFIISAWKKPWVKIILYSVALFLILQIANVDTSTKNIFGQLYELLTSKETISFFTAGIITVILFTIGSYIGNELEDSLKIEDDSLTIIRKYDGYKIDEKADSSSNYYNKKGALMRLNRITKKGKIKNKVKDKYSKAFVRMQDVQKAHDRGELILPTVNVFTNVEQNVKLNFHDSLAEKKLPDFVISNAQEFLQAHKYSNTNNNVTIRLDDFSFNDKENELNLYTSRTYYYHMLLTNRCMDFQISSGLSIRNLYEFNSTISPLNESKLSNQIGINGVIMTSDGYLLLEKRGKKKTTWKNKFAQPISLALKENDLELGDNRIMSDEFQYAEEKIINVIEKTVKSNFGLTREDYEPLSIEKNLLGIARDLLEGGKPNIYFIMTLKSDHVKTKEMLEKNAKATSGKVLGKEKLKSNYFLIDYNDIKINTNYGLKVSKKKAVRVRRKISPRTCWLSSTYDYCKYGVSRIIKPNLKFGCGEALLVCLSYLELCKKNFIEIRNK
ncbi:MAG: hypothetical protein J6V68_04485 [Clostridia bacterium]|nr:hypothetical protein [Clostridia bacterium]